MAVLITYVTESGDEGDLGVFTRAPTDNEKKAIVNRLLPSEIVDDDGVKTSYAHLTVIELGQPTSPPIPTEEEKAIEWI